jgi:hypothetical protein
MSKDIYYTFMTAMDGVSHHVEPISDCSTTQCGVTKILYDSGVLHVWLTRPGLFIGKAGSNFNKIKTYVETPIELHQVKNLWDPQELKK